MAQKINISKYRNNSHYSVSVTDKFGTEHHLGYYSDYSKMHDIEDAAKFIWENAVEPKENLMGKAIAECIKIDEARGRTPNLD